MKGHSCTESLWSDRQFLLTQDTQVNKIIWIKTWITYSGAYSVKICFKGGKRYILWSQRNEQKINTPSFYNAIWLSYVRIETADGKIKTLKNVKLIRA